MLQYLTEAMRGTVRLLRWYVMKKLSIILIGILSPLYYEFVINMMMYTEYIEKYAFIQNLMLFVLPALPGLVIAFALVRNSFKEFFISLGICFLLSTIVFNVYDYFDINLTIQKTLTGYDEFSNGAGILFIITFLSYTVSCFIGAFISGVASFIKQTVSTPKYQILKNNTEGEK